MNLDIKKVKIFTTVSGENLTTVRDAMCEAGAGVIGNYDHCAYSCKGVGSFRPNDEAHPYEEPAIDIVPLLDESLFV